MLFPSQIHSAVDSLMRNVGGLDHDACISFLSHKRRIDCFAKPTRNSPHDISGIIPTLALVLNFERTVSVENLPKIL